MRCAGRAAAARYWITAKYDIPAMPALPSHHGCVAAHSIVAATSFCSWGSNWKDRVPPERPVPRAFTVSCAYPQATMYLTAPTSLTGSGMPVFCSSLV